MYPLRALSSVLDRLYRRPKRAETFLPKNVMIEVITMRKQGAGFNLVEYLDEVLILLGDAGFRRTVIWHIGGIWRDDVVKCKEEHLIIGVYMLGEADGGRTPLGVEVGPWR